MLPTRGALLSSHAYSSYAYIGNVNVACRALPRQRGSTLPPPTCGNCTLPSVKCMTLSATPCACTLRRVSVVRGVTPHCNLGRLASASGMPATLIISPEILMRDVSFTKESYRHAQACLDPRTNGANRSDISAHSVRACGHTRTLAQLIASSMRRSSSTVHTSVISLFRYFKVFFSEGHCRAQACSAALRSVTRTCRRMHAAAAPRQYYNPPTASRPEVCI